MREVVPTVITAKRSDHPYCVCNLCGTVDYVAKIEYTLPRFHESGAQKRKRLWLCDECRNKMIDALKGCDDGKE